MITDPLGGLINVRVLRKNNNAHDTRIILGSGAIAAPFYLHRVTTPSQWQTMLVNGNTPEVQLSGEYVTISVFHETAMNFIQVNPLTIIGSHQLILSVEADICGLDESTSLNSRYGYYLYAVEGPAGSIPHATTGYIAIPHGDSMKKMMGGHSENYWMMLHEYGHHYQSRYNAFSPLNEVSPNLYALAVGRVAPNDYTDEFPERWPSTQAWLALPREEKDFNKVNDPQAIYEQLRIGLGEAFLSSWQQYFRRNNTMKAGLENYVVSASIVAQYALADFFADWGLLKESDTDIWDAVAALGLPPPPMNLTAIRPYM